MDLHDLARLAYLNRRAMRRQWWDRDRLRALQSRRFAEIASHAYRHTAFYRSLFDAHPVAPGSDASLERLRDFPIVNKAAVQEAEPGNLVSDTADPERLIRMTTSGSTGRPLSVHFSRAEFIQHHRASFSRFYREYGRRIGHVVAYLSKSDTVIRTKSSFIHRLVPHRFIIIDAFTPVDEQVDRLLEIQPDVVTGYTKSIELLAQAIVDRGITRLRPRLVYTGADTLSAMTRPAVARAFGTELFDTYNCIEFGNIAWECPSRSGLYHVNEDLLIVETVDENGNAAAPGVPGSVVVTSLFNRTQPFIRYRLGDIATFSEAPCPCGRGLATLQGIAGRIAEAILLPDGRRITSAYFAIFFRGCEKVRQYQVVQTAADRLTLRIVRRDDACDLEAERQALEDRLQCCTVGLEYVTAIPLAGTAKFRTLIPWSGEDRGAATRAGTGEIGQPFVPV